MTTVGKDERGTFRPTSGVGKSRKEERMEKCGESWWLDRGVDLAEYEDFQNFKICYKGSGYKKWAVKTELYAGLVQLGETKCHEN